MELIDTKSLSSTIDRVNEALFFKHTLSKSQKTEVAKWIAGRQGMAGSYADMFAPTEKDFMTGAKLFTGESIKSRAGTAHILGEEACRVLILLDIPISTVQMAIEKANRGMIKRLDEQNQIGMYCCGNCSVSYWRHLAVGGLKEGERRLAAGMKSLKSHRDGKGRWRIFPYYYTLLSLSEIEIPSAIQEMRYSAKTCEKALKHLSGNNKFHQRRRVILEKILGKC